MILQFKGKNVDVLIEIVETGEQFETRSECAKKLGVHVSSISQALNARVKTVAGYHLRYIKGYIVYYLTPDILNELADVSVASYEEWWYHPRFINVFVSTEGQVAVIRHKRLYVVEQYPINSGYLVASIYTKPGSNKLELIHRMVAETFIPNPNNYGFVNHIDGNKFNNSVGNLEWCNRSQNMIHAVKKGLAKTERVIVTETGKEYSSSVECARAIGGTVSGIHDCKTGRQKVHRGYHFIFPEDYDE